jgi:hypothetical protein
MACAAHPIAVTATPVLNLLGYSLGLQGLIGRRHWRSRRKLRVERQSANQKTRGNCNVS